MSDFKIERGVPIPITRQGGRRYPWREMEVGDSVFIPAENGENPKKTMNRLGASLAYCKPYAFTRRLVDGGVRVWRTK